MSPEQFRQVEELYHAAREGTAEERAALLTETDPELRRQVEALLSKPSSGQFLDCPAIGNATEPADDSSSMTAGALLGPYGIESKPARN